MTEMIKVSAPGKVHLSGEHSVVYGQPALLAAIDRRLFISLKPRKDKKIELNDKFGLAEFGVKRIYQYLRRRPNKGFNLRIDSEIPIGSGLGSSAALAAALTGVILTFEERSWDKNLINKIAYEIEKKQHGNPSGGDNTAVCYGGLLRFQKKDDKFEFGRLNLDNCKSPEFTLVDSGRPKESTGEMVEIVNQKLKTKNEKHKLKYEKIIESIGKVTNKFIKAFKFKKFKMLKSLIMENERLLGELGVVGNKAKEIIKKIEKIGGVAKICGAGGIKEGSGMILAYHLSPQRLMNVLEKENLEYIRIKLGEEGARIEQANSC